MIVSIHQPNYIPWIGYFDKLAQSDVHVFLDDVKYSKNGYTNRNKILMNSKEIYLTVPVSKEYYNSNISEVEIRESKWKKKHTSTLRQAYSKAKYTSQYLPKIEEIIRSGKNLSEMNSSIITWMCEQFDINTKFVFSSKLDKSKKLAKTELLVDICQSLGASKYVSGAGAKDYLRVESFSNIDLAWQHFVHPEYKQRSNSFVKNLSALDLLFNEGPDSRRFFKSHEM